MSRDLEKLRNIGIIAHIDAGKTTVTERMLFYSGASHRMGDVDKGTTVTDYDPEEQQRGITIIAACVTFPWRDAIVNLIDTPGHVDFTAEVERSLRVLDGGVVVFSAREGVEAQSETVWRQADKYHVPRVAFINKMDREGADFEGTLDEIGKRLGSNPIAVQIPLGSGPPHQDDAFRGVVDLIDMKLLTFSEEGQGKEINTGEIPEDFREEAELWRDQMLESLFDFSNELGELHLAEEEVPPELVRRVLRDATVHNLAVPVLCGSALDFIGIQPLLDAVVDFLPSPADMPPVEGIDPKKPDKKLVRNAKPDDPFCGLVFKIQADKHGDLHYVRVYSGQLKSNSRLLNVRENKKENVAQLWHIQADRRKQVDSVEAGDIIGIIGLRHSVTGDTLTSTHDPISLESIEFPETVISMAIEPESSTDRKKLSETLTMLNRQDPTFRADENPDTGQTLISGMGELHLEVIKHRLLRDFNLNVRVHKPRVSYRETVASPAEATGVCDRQVAGQPLFAEVKLRLEPQDLGAGSFVTIAPAAIEQIIDPFMAPVTEVLEEMIAGGGSLGFPLTDIKVTVLGGTVHETNSTEIAFRHAAAEAFNQALLGAGVVLLEPIMKLEITVPEENLGDFVADLQQRRATITGTTNRGSNTILKGLAPLASLFGYSVAMRSMSQGRATCSMEPAEYGPAPPEVLQNFQ